MLLCQAIHNAALLAVKENRHQYIMEYEPGIYCVAQMASHTSGRLSYLNIDDAIFTDNFLNGRWELARQGIIWYVLPKTCQRYASKYDLTELDRIPE